MGEWENHVKIKSHDLHVEKNKEKFVWGNFFENKTSYYLPNTALRTPQDL